MKLTNAAEELSSIKLASHLDVVSSLYVCFLIDHVGDEEATELKTANTQISNLESELSETKRELTTSTLKWPSHIYRVLCRQAFE